MLTTPEGITLFRKSAELGGKSVRIAVSADKGEAQQLPDKPYRPRPEHRKLIKPVPGGDWV